eukprot:3569536-Rhodomonas_salina.1
MAALPAFSGTANSLMAAGLTRMAAGLTRMAAGLTRMAAGRAETVRPRGLLRPDALHHHPPPPDL